MNKRKKILLTIFISASLFSIIIFTSFSWLYYSGRINTYQPITIKNANNEKVDFKVYGTTPLGRVFLFTQCDSLNASCYYSFCRQIEIQFQKKNINSKHNIIMTIGNTAYHYQIVGNSRFIKPAQDRGNVSYWRALGTMLFWKITKILFKIILVLFFVFATTWMLKQSGRNSLMKLIKRFQFIVKFVALILIHALIISFILILLILVLNHPILNILEHYCGIIYSLILILFLFGSCIIILYAITRLIHLTKNFLYLIIMFQVSLFLALILSEILLRFVPELRTHDEEIGRSIYISTYKMFVPKHVFTHAPNQMFMYSTNEFSYQHKINSIGLRNNEIPIKKNKKNEFRIFAIGDSFTEGVGVSQDSTWPNLLANKLNKNNDSIYFNVINAGRMGSDPLFGYVLLKNKLLQYQPDIVLYTLNYGDINDLTIRGGMERFKPNDKVEFQKGPFWESLYAISYTFRLIVRNLLQYNLLLQPIYKTKENEDKALYSLYKCSKDFEKIGKQNKFSSICLLHPYPTDFGTGNNFLIQPYIDKFKKYFPQKCINLYQYFADSLKMNSQNVYNYYWKNDRHHNGRGCDAFAQGVYLKLKEMGVLNKQINK